MPIMPDYKEAFIQYINANNVDGSGKASSYIRAIDLLCEMLEARALGFDDCKNVWSVSSVERLHELYLFVLAEARKNDASAWNIQGIPKSYLQKGYCSAALKSYQEFLVEYNYENSVLTAFEEYSGDEAGVIEKLDIDLIYPDFLIDDSDNRVGEDVIRSVNVRSNQSVFRKMILKIYNQSCCITGLNIPEVNRASHIIPWAEDACKRLDPRNGLCLSATYDAAFDRNLISLDDEYRMIVSNDIKDHYSSESVKKCFINKEGFEIILPTKYKPNKDYLAEHRRKGSF